MTKIIVHLANGFEEMEALIPVDVWRRAGFQVETVSLTNELKVTGSHQIQVMADCLFEEAVYNDADMIYLPGGMPGASNLDAHKGLRKEILSFAKNGKVLGAICAAPLVLGHNHLLEGKKATCFPGYEKDLYGADYTAVSVQTAENIVTGKGAGVAFEFALQIVSRFTDAASAKALSQKMQVAPGFSF